MRVSLVDFVWGLIAFACVLVVSVVSRQHQDIRVFSLAVSVAFFSATYFRSNLRRGRIPTTLLPLVLGGITPVVVMNRLNIAFTARSFFISFVLLSVVAAALGLGTRLLKERGQVVWAAILGVSTVIAVLIIACIAVPHWVENGAYRSVDQDVGAFNVESLAGDVVSSETWKGSVVVLSFWATWCTPCHAELPEIAALQSKYRDNASVRIIVLNSGNHGETPSKAQTYLARKGLKLNAAIDSYGVDPADDSWGPAAKNLGLGSIPAVYILDRSGRLRVIHYGYDASEHLADSLSSRIDRLL